MRSAAYIQSLCSLVLFGLGSRYDVALRGTLVLTSLALVETIAVFSFKSELSLHHAMVSLSLLTVVMLPLHFIESWRIKSPGLFVAQQVRLGTYAAMQLWLALQAPCFGSNPECNLCTKTVFAWSVSYAVGMFASILRIFTVGLIASAWLNATFWVYGPLHSIAALLAMFSESRSRRWIEFAETTDNDLTTWRQKELKRLRRKGGWGGIVLVFFLWYEDTTPVQTIINARRWNRVPASSSSPGWLRRVWSDARQAFAAPRFQRMAIGLVFSIVYVSNTEYTVRINLDDGANSWGFGQILSMVTAVPFVASFIKYSFQLGARRR